MKYLVILLSFLALSTSAQESKSFEQDTLAFRTYLCGDNIGTAMDLSLLIRTYRHLSASEGKEVQYVPINRLPAPFASYPKAVYPNGKSHYEGPIDGLASIVRYGDINVGDWHPGGGGIPHMDNTRFPDSLRLGIKENVRHYRETIDRKAEKKRLVENLRKFDRLSGNKPIFFATIYSEYEGDIKKYVDDLYSKSIMGSSWRMTRFCRWPSAKKLQKDLSVQFAIGLALYDLWLKQTKAEMAAAEE